METRITLWLENSEKTKIEAKIKQEYPKIKTVSELVRLAIDSFLNE
jgi:hypothetical protein